MKSSPKAKSGITPSLILLLITAFLAPIFGGYVATDQTSLPHDYGEILRQAFGGSDAPVLTHALIAMPSLLAVLLMLVRHRVQQVPKQILSLIWIVFFLFLGASSLFSTMRGLSISIWLEWLCFGCAFFGAIAISGRRLGVQLLLAAIIAGNLFVSINGILEYGQMRFTDPSWRIFAGWVNPNATAAILLLGTFAALGVCLSSSRAAALFSGIAGALMIVATVLTGSKGAVSLALPIGFLAFGAFQARSARWILPSFAVGGFLAVLTGVMFLKNVGWLGMGMTVLFSAAILGFVNRDRIGAARFLGTVGTAAAFLLLLNLTTPVPKSAPPGATQATQATPMSRVSEGSQTQEQSSEFRLNLWKSAAFLIKERPMQGFGLGSYRNESARAGLTTATMFSHNIYLQIWSETGAIPILLFFAGIGVWANVVGKGRSRLPGGQLSLLTGCFAAVVALLVHGLVDSDLYYFGIGTVFFLLMGAALNLAGDAVAPELVQRPVRILAAVACCGISGLLLLFSLNDIQKGIVRRDIATRDSQSLKEDAEGLGWATSFDGEARYLQAMTAPRDRIGKELQDAYEMLPTERVARMLANVLSSGGKFAQAEDVLRGALERDPNNMLTLSLLAKIQAQKGDQGAAVATAKKLVATESTPYFKVRSIPESVPTWTYDARLDFLAPAATDQAEKAKLLAEAVKGYLEYAKVTVPIIKRNATSQDQIPGFDTEEEAKFKLQKAIDGGETAIQIYRKVGGGDPAELEGEVKDLLAALAAA